MKKNNDGFTLIEMIVSIAIGVMVIGLAGSIIVSSFRLYGDLSDSGLRKEALDDIVDYVDDELKNATEVCYSRGKPDDSDWNWLCIKGGRLYRNTYAENDDSKGVFTADYYNSSALTMAFDSRNGEKKVSMTISYSLKGKDETYKKNDTIRFNNMRKSASSPYGETSLKEDAIRGNFDIAKNGHKYIYYKTDASQNTISGAKRTVVTPEKRDYTSTIEDKIQLITAHMNRGYFEPNTSNSDDYFKYPHNVFYYLGDCVYYQGDWYMKIFNNNTQPNAPKGEYGFQKLSRYYDPDNYYTKGDIILTSNGDAYQWNGDWIVHDVAPDDTSNGNARNWYKMVKNLSSLAKPYTTNDQVNVGDYVSYQNDYYQRIAKNDIYNAPSMWGSDWRKVKELPDGTKNYYENNMGTDLDSIEEIEAPKNSPLAMFNTLRTAKGESVLSFNAWDHTYAGVDEYDSTKTYQVGDICKVRHFDDTGTTDPYYQLYGKIGSPGRTAPGGTSFDDDQGMASGWMLLENEYQPYSAYMQNTAVRVGVNGPNTAGYAQDYIVALGGDLFQGEDDLILLDENLADVLNEKIIFEDGWRSDRSLPVYYTGFTFYKKKYSLLTYMIYDNNSSLNGDVLNMRYQSNNNDLSYADLNRQIWKPASASELS